DAGPDQTGIASGSSATLDATASSDPDAGDTLSYAWTQTDSSGRTVTLSDSEAAQPTFAAPTLGANDAAVTLTFELVVTDDKGNASSADTVDITVTPPANTAPTADAGPDQTGIASGSSATLDATASSDPDAGDTLSYAWTQTDSSGRTVTLSDSEAAQPTFAAPTLGANDAAVTLTFELVVTDDKGNASSADTVDIT
uniref:PKD domain-containing protein n=1 Tax=Roseovarius halophilus (ex Wu et al. 2025) TaxID=3376060 RepID=UPI003999A855